MFSHSKNSEKDKIFGNFKETKVLKKSKKNKFAFVLSKGQMGKCRSLIFFDKFQISFFFFLEISFYFRTLKTVETLWFRNKKFGLSYVWST